MGEQRDDTAVAGLAEVIGQVRHELEQAQHSGAESDLRFSVESVNLEFAVQVRKEGSGRAGVQIGVIAVGAGGSASRDTTHRITIELKPHGRDTSHYSVGGE
ncbi:trypco2 family protein [Streptomyces sp. NPDC058220]|uniref:trypco2 family protein n=1 Tax=unclassified Streptomyces TaxID=2593676 RepID=UPI003650F8AC